MVGRLPDKNLRLNLIATEGFVDITIKIIKLIYVLSIGDMTPPLCWQSIAGTCG